MGTIRRPGRRTSVLACVSGTDCWAVGSAELNGVTRHQVLRLNGRKWYPVPAPSPGGTALDDSSYLTDLYQTMPDPHLLRAGMPIGA